MALHRPRKDSCRMRAETQRQGITLSQLSKNRCVQPSNVFTDLHVSTSDCAPELILDHQPILGRRQIQKKKKKMSSASTGNHCVSHYQRERWEEGGTGIWDWYVHTIVYKTDGQRGPAVYRAQGTLAIFCDNLYGERI